MSTQRPPDLIEMKAWCLRVLRFLLSKESTDLERRVLLVLLKDLENVDPSVNPKGIRAAYKDLVAMVKLAPESLRRELDELAAASETRDLRTPSDARWNSLLDEILDRGKIGSPEDRQFLVDALDQALEQPEPDEKRISRIRELLEDF